MAANTDQVFGLTLLGDDAGTAADFEARSKVNILERWLDALTVPQLIDLDETTPSNTTEGALTLIAGSGVTKTEWQGHEGELTLAVAEDTWEFATLPEGLFVYDMTADVRKVWNGASWDTISM